MFVNVAGACGLPARMPHGFPNVETCRGCVARLYQGTTSVVPIWALRNKGFSRLKPTSRLVLAARLKSCPDTKHSFVPHRGREKQFMRSDRIRETMRRAGSLAPQSAATGSAKLGDSREKTPTFS